MHLHQLWSLAAARGGVGVLAVGELALSVVVSRWRFGSLAWGLVAWLWAAAGTLASLLVLAGHRQAWPLALHHGIWLLAGLLAIEFAILGCALEERHGRGRGVRRLLRTGIIFAIALVVVVLVGLGRHGGLVAAALARGLPLPVVVIAGFCVLVRTLRAPAGSRPVCGWTLLNSLCGYGVFASGCAQAPALAVIALISGARRLSVLRGCTRIWMRLVYACTPTVRWRFQGAIDGLNGRALVVANHESMLDILSATALPGDRNLLAKTWVFRAPFLGLGARSAGIHNVDTLSVDAYLEAPQRLLGRHEGLFVFPEGRRSRTGLLGRFHLGAFHLAIATHAPVVPVAMCGSAWSLPPQLIWIHPGELHARVLRPMARLGQESARAFSERVRAHLAQETIHGRTLLLDCAFNRLNRRGWQLGRRPGERRGAAREDALIAPALAAVAAPGSWLQLGAGWGACALIMRQLVPAAAVSVLEPSALKRASLAALGLPSARLLREMPTKPLAVRIVVLWEDPVLVCAALARMSGRAVLRLVVLPRGLVEAAQVVLSLAADGQPWRVEVFGAFTVLRHPRPPAEPEPADEEAGAAAAGEAAGPGTPEPARAESRR